MIIDINQDRLDEVCKYVYELNANKEFQCRPFKNDIILSEIQEKFYDLVFHEGDRVLACVDDKHNIIGVLGLFTELEDNYLQAFCGVYAHSNYEQVGNEFIAYLEKEYKGLNMLFAFPKENIQGIELMNKHDFISIEDAVIYELSSLIENNDSHKNIISNDLISIEEVIKFYKENQEDVYWTINKILLDETKWVIRHYIKDEKIVGSVYCRIYNSYSAEIFGILSLNVMNRDEIELELVKQVSIECQQRGISNVTLFSDLTRYNVIAETIGFIEVDTHLTFERKL